MFETGAASVFVPSDMLKIRAESSEHVQEAVRKIRAQHSEARPSLAFDVVHDRNARDGLWHRNPLYRLARRLLMGSNHDQGLSKRTVWVNGLAVNRSLHAVLTNHSKKKSDRSYRDGLLPQIVLGLPFFLRHKVVFSEELNLDDEMALAVRRRFVHID